MDSNTCPPEGGRYKEQIRVATQVLKSRDVAVQNEGDEAVEAIILGV